jgi:branched-chain amino acid transport system ATP-binding protein
VVSREKKKEVELIEGIAKIFPRLAERLDQAAVTMSSGEQQMLAIARTMIAEPDLIMLDEPSEGIMPVLVDEMFELFRAMKAQGTTVLLVEQNMELALDIADRADVLDQGAVIYHAAARELLADNEIKERYCSVCAYSAAALASVLACRVVTTTLMASSTRSRAYRSAVGSSASANVWV